MIIRKTKNSADNISLQVGYYVGKRFILVKHIGSAKNEFELDKLYETANSFIHQNQLQIFENSTQLSNIVHTEYTRESMYLFFEGYYNKVFKDIKNDVIKDLTILRIIKPTSKLESIELLKEYFGISYSYTTLRRKLCDIDKDIITTSLFKYAEVNLGFDFSLVFYDVTTLYFESKPDEDFKKPGFSKDGKHSNPQIMVGLMVDQYGFPLYFESFKGNSFEGHTLIPVIQGFKKKFGIKKLTVVADSAMLSEANLSALEALDLKYIVGNRIHSTYKDIMKDKVLNIKKTDGSTFVSKEGHRQIIYHFSKKRERKDKYEIEKAFRKALELQAKQTKPSKHKFLMYEKQSFQVDMDQVDKYRLLAGVKSYKTNLDVQPELIVDRYSDLWNIENSFRMSKHDLKARPIFHRKEEAIKSHLIIVFMACAVSKVIEKATDKSINRVLKEQMQIIDVIFTDKNGTISKCIARPKKLPH